MVPWVVHIVVPGDSLWALAQTYLGDGHLWPEIEVVGRGTTQQCSPSVVRPTRIFSGEILLIPLATSGSSKPPWCQAGQPGSSPSSSVRPSPSSSATRPRQSATAVGSGREHRSWPQVWLPAIVGLAALCAAASAVATGRRIRRRRRQHGQPRTDRPPSGPWGGDRKDLDDADSGHSPIEVPAKPPGWRYGAEVHHVPRATIEGRLDPSQPLMPAPGTGGTLLATARPEVAVFSPDEDAERELPLDQMAGLALDGPGAEDVARGIVVTFLARHAQVVVTVDDFSTLLPGDAASVSALPGLTSAASPEDALNLMETELLRRQRLLDAADLASLDADRENQSGEISPDLLLIALSGYPPSRLAATLGLGRSLGITGITTVRLTGGTTCTVAADGQVIAASGPASGDLLGIRLLRLTPADAVSMLSAFAVDRGGPEPEFTSGSMQAADDGTPTTPVYLSVLGTPGIQVGESPVTKGLRSKAFELLAYLAVHPAGATTAEILDDLWRATPERRAAAIAHTVISNIRQTLRAAVASAPDADFLKHHRGRYSIDTNLIDTDLWHFQADLAAAARADTDEGHISVLSDAASLWRGDFADGYDAEWLVPWRESLRRDAADVLCQLATLHEHSAPEQAIQYLERATTIDRYQESLYQRIIRLQGALGRPEAACRTYQLLESRLAELDAQPDTATTRALSEVLMQNR